jgi:hypothetical protein
MRQGIKNKFSKISVSVSDLFLEKSVQTILLFKF